MAHATRSAWAAATLVLALACGGGTPEADGAAPADVHGVDMRSVDIGPWECNVADPCGPSNYAPAVEESALHVNACCVAEIPDGTLAAPFQTLAAALAVASDGTVIAVAAGTYVESIQVDIRSRCVGVRIDFGTDG